MAHRYLHLACLALTLVAGCSQLIGLSDYEIDKSLDAVGGQPAGGEGAGASAGEATGGDAPGTVAGASAGGQGGAAGGSEGGEPSVGAGGEGGAGGAEPLLIDCDSADCCEAEGGTIVETELILNGDFERGRAAWSGGYKVNTDYNILSRANEDTIVPTSGEWYAWLGGAVEDACYLDSPSFVIPKRTGWLTASGYRLFAFDSMTGTGDQAAIIMYEAGTSNDVLTFAYWDNYEYDNDDFEEFAYTAPAAEFAGGDYQLSLLAETDGMFDDAEQKASNFFFDDLSLKAAVCVAK